MAMSQSTILALVAFCSSMVGCLAGCWRGYRTGWEEGWKMGHARGRFEGASEATKHSMKMLDGVEARFQRIIDDLAAKQAAALQKVKKEGDERMLQQFRGVRRIISDIPPNS
jgi:hypothetical protein